MGAYYNVLAVYRDVAQFGSAPRSGRGGRRFESCHLDQQKSHPPIVDGFFVGGNCSEMKNLENADRHFVNEIHFIMLKKRLFHDIVGYIENSIQRNGVGIMARSHDDFVEIVKVKNPSVEIVGTYTKAQERIAVRCKACGYEWTPKAYSLIQGRSCRYCSAKRSAKNNNGKTGLKTQQQFLSEMSEVHPSIKVVGEYLNGHTDIQCACTVCGHNWKAKPYSLLQGHGCPRCAKSGTSFMEQFIKCSFEMALGEDRVLSRDKTAIGMELDIYIPSLKIAFEPGNWFLHKKSLNRDKTKRERCKEKGIRLITIYDKFPLTEQMPFENDCLVFNDDLNKTDHSVIRDLVKRLFEIADIQYRLNDPQWSTIERQSYDNAKAKTHEDFVESMSALHPTIEVLGKYVNANKRLLVKCTVCGFEWDGVPANMLAGDGCRKCGTKLAHQKFVKEQEEFEEQVWKANPDIEVIGTYTGRHNPIQAKCRICGHIWNPRASSLLRGSNHKGWKTIHTNCLDKENEKI